MKDLAMITKAAKVEAKELNDEELAKINQFTLEPLTADEVFTFRSVLCDNEVDRTYEHFSYDALKEMAEAYIGKTVIKDHEWSADNQVARIYDAEVVRCEGDTLLDEPYHKLVASCYMVKTAGNADLVAEIKGGIKKEGSVGLRVGSCVCSVCGKDALHEYCKHDAGQTYDDGVCTYTLGTPVDALEFSLVAVPAQPAAGISKSYHEELKAEADKAEAEALEQKRIEDEIEALKLELEMLKGV